MKLIACFYSDWTETALQSQIDNSVELAETSAKEYGVAIEQVSCECRIPRKGIKAHKLYDYGRAGPRILKEGREGNLTYLSLYSIPTRQDAFAAFDWLFFVGVGLYEPVRLVTMQVGIDIDILHAIGAGSSTTRGIVDLCESVCKLISGRYGFVTIMPRDFMPAGYATGLLGRAPEKLVWDANSWSRGAWKQYAEVLRNVHGINFVNAHHLEQHVGNRTLGEWIKTSRSRGVIEPWETGLFLWSFADSQGWPEVAMWDNSVVVNAREELEQHNYFPWQKFIAED
jgi:hypothetical protein